MRFSEPLYLFLLIPVLAGLGLSFRHVHGMARGRKRIAFVLRFLLVSLLVFALAGPEAHRPNVGACTMFLLDRSDSISDADRRRSEDFVNRAMQQLGPDDAAGVIVFGKDAVIDSAPGGRRSLGQVLSKVDGSATDLAGTIRLAGASFLEGKSRRIVVLSDGNETLGDSGEAAEVASTENVPIDQVALGLNDRKGDASVIELQTPDEIRANQPFEVRVIVDSSVDQTGVLTLDRNGVMDKRVAVKLTKGRNSIVLSERVSDPGFHRYRATLDARQDTDPRNNVGIGFVAVRGKPKVLILQSNPATSVLADAIRKHGLDVQVAGPGGMPARPEKFQVYDAILFNDFPANRMTERQMKLTQAAVRDTGVGFGMIGGENSFLPGGYYGTSIAEILPVDLNIRQRKTFPTTSILIIMDCSGSMQMEEDGVVKLRLAAKAAEETVKLVSPLDRVGVAGSADGVEFVVPMQQMSDKAGAIDKIRHIDISGGGIYIRPSLEAGDKVLMGEPSKVRHLIMLCDGNDSTDWDGVLARAARMRADKITTSIVAVGDGKDAAMLRQLAFIGGGRFYIATKASQLPALVTQDTAVMSRSAIEEGAFVPKLLAGEDILRGIGDSGVPPLLAYDLTDSRPLARVGMKTGKDDPLLATWQYGLGTSLAFTSDAQARWAAKWVGWDGFGTFWAQAVRAISRRATDNQYQVAVHQSGGKGRIQVNATDRLGNPLNTMDAQVRVSTPSGDVKEVNVSQEGPGQYGGAFEASELGSYVVTVAEPGGNRTHKVSASGFSIPYPPEYRTYTANRPLLQRLSQTTGGMALSKPEEALRAFKNPGESVQELWRLMLLCAALLLPIDIGVRRLALPMGEAWARVLAQLRDRSRSRVAEQQEVVGRLQKAKERVRQDLPVAATIPFQKSEETAAEKPPPRRPGAPSGGSAASSLLEAKRKRRERD